MCVCATILQLGILDPRLLGDVQSANLEFKILKSRNIESCVPFFIIIIILGFKIQDSHKTTILKS